MNKRNFFIINKLVKNTALLASLVVIILLISSSAISVTFNKIPDRINLDLDLNEEEKVLNRSLTGLPPEAMAKKMVLTNPVHNKNELEENVIDNSAQLTVYRMYGYIAYASGYGEGPCYFYTDCSDFTFLGPTASGDFLSGGTWMADERWICCEYGSGVLWEIDPEDGDMTSIGGGGQAMNGLSWDPLNNQMYGVGNTCDLFKVDYETGETELVGNGGISDTLIALVFDADANAYAWDVKFSGNTCLYSVDLETGALTTIGSMGKTLCYAQDGDICFEDGALYLTAYIYNPEYGGYLCKVDLETGELEIICVLEGGAEIDASMFINEYIPPEHDVGIKEIVKPEGSGYAVPEVPMQVLVKNYGIHPEVTDIQMEVIKCEAGPLLLEEYFDGTFPPEGWTTDWWTQSNTSFAGGEPPEACCCKYDQYNGSDYYDNYIQSPPIDCTGIEKVNLKFRWAADVQYNNYCSFFLKYRKNSTSPWKDVSPWVNPFPSDMEGDYWEIGCYGFGETLGDGFQFRFEYLGYYYYYNKVCLDDVILEACGGCADYAEIVEDVSIAAGEEILVDFPGYIPPEWQNESYEDTWEEYPIHAFTLLTDQKPKNDDKWKLIDLYYPYLHDVEVSSIDSPAERSIPGQVLPVQATIKNVGQYPECCIPIDIKIGQGILVDSLLTEDMSGGVPPAGWTDEHKGYVSYYGWSTSYTSYSGGSSPEGRLPYYYALADYVMYTPVIDTSTYPGLKIKFKSYVNHYSGQGLYALEAGYSTDLVNWYASWHEEPGSSGQYEVECDAVGGSATTYVGWWMKGDPWYINYWYLDDVEVVAVDLVEEYADNMCQGPDLEPGETRVFEFDDWTPNALEEEITTTNDYLIEASIEMEGDKDPGNDLASGKFTLEFWHDAAVEVSNPALGAEPETWLHFDDGTPVNAIGLTCSGTFEYAIRLTPDELADYDGNVISTVKRFHGYNTDFQMSGVVRIYDQGTSTSPGDEITNQPFECYENDWHDIVLDKPVQIYGDRDIWVSIEVTHLAGQYPAAMDASNNYPTKGDWVYLSSWVEISIYGFYGDWCIWAGVESGFDPGGIKTYIQPGTQDIEGLATNFGTFPELDLTCYAEIYEYITNCTNGTLVYEDNITDIDLDTPLGGSELLNFDKYNFAEEGPYGLFLNMTNENDDKPKNNEIIWGIGVDNTPPKSTHTIEPATPDGDNGWYVSDLEVTIYAHDPSIGCGYPGSGVKEIKFKIGGGSTQTITGSSGSFIVDVDAENLVIEYWAVDYVGNAEIPHTITIDMDQTDPILDMTYEWTNGPYPNSWWMIFTVTATDATSGMDRVEFYLNNVIQDTVTGPGPEFEWKFLYSGGLDITIDSIGYDKAGNMVYDEITNPENINVNIKQYQSTKILQITQKHLS